MTALQYRHGDYQIDSVNKYPLSQIGEHRSGSGAPPVLLLHGWGGDQHTLTAIGKPLAQHREVISLAMPGFGSSPEPPEPWGSWEYVELLKIYFEEKRLEKCDVIAHSFGGRISIGFAGKYPQHVNRLILIGSAGLKPIRSLRTQMKIIAAKTLKHASKISGGSLSAYLEKLRSQLKAYVQPRLAWEVALLELARSSH